MASDYARGVLRIIVGQICQVAGYTSIEATACEALVDLLQRYIEDIGTFSRMNADHAGRVDCNILDVRGALDELRSSVQELHEYMNEAEEITFDRATPHFPMGPKAKKKAAVSMQPPRHNIPEHFPPFPDAHTFRFTPINAEQELDKAELRKKKNIERSLILSSLDHLLLSRDSRGPVLYNNVEYFELMPEDDYQRLQEANKDGLEMDWETDLSPPTPVDSQSPYMSQVYTKIGEVPIDEKPDRILTEKEQNKIDAILSLQHSNNGLEEIEIEEDEIPPTPVKETKPSVSIPTTPSTPSTPKTPATGYMLPFGQRTGAGGFPMNPMMYAMNMAMTPGANFSPYRHPMAPMTPMTPMTPRTNPYMRFPGTTPNYAATPSYTPTTPGYFPSTPGFGTPAYGHMGMNPANIMNAAMMHHANVNRFGMNNPNFMANTPHTNTPNSTVVKPEI